MLQFLVKAGGRLAVLGLTAVLSVQAARAGGLSPGIPDPCAGPGAMLALLDRPTVGDSPCVVKPDHMVLEAGVARYALYGLSGHAWGYPQLELRWGLPGHNEWVLLPPNISRVSIPAAGGVNQASTGGSASVAGIKHEFGYNEHWLWAGEMLITLPSGSPTFGSAATGYAVNGIVSYSPAPAFGLTLMFGGAHYAQPREVQGGAYYWTLNPDLVATWQPAPDVQWYAEVYGQEHAGPGQASAYNADGGIQYLVNPDFELDAEIGQRLSGNLAGWSHYLGVGLGLLF